MLLRFSCGPMVSALKRSSTALMSPDEYWNSLLLLLKMTSAIWQSHSTDSSIAFFIRPFLRFVNVTCIAAGRAGGGGVSASRGEGEGGVAFVSLDDHSNAVLGAFQIIKCQ